MSYLYRFKEQEDLHLKWKYNDNKSATLTIRHTNLYELRSLEMVLCE